MALPNLNTRESPVVYVSLLRKGTNDIDVNIQDSVVAFKYTDSDKKTDKCVFTVRNHDLSNFDKPLWKKGARLRVQWGYLGAVSQTRTVIIESVKGFSTLEVEAHGVDSLMNKTKKPRVFRNITRSGVANAVAHEWGFAEPNRFIQPTTQIFPQISQGGETDAKLMARLARKEDFVFYVDFDGFHWHERDVKQAACRRYVYGASAQISEMVLGEPQIENDVTVPRYKGVRRKGVDKETGEPFDEVASNTDTERDGLAPVLDNIEDISTAELDLDSMGKELEKLGSEEGSVAASGGEVGGWMTGMVNATKSKISSGLTAIEYEIAKSKLDGGASYNPEEILYSDPDGVDFTDPDASANYTVVEVIDARDSSTTQILVGADSQGYTPIDESPSSASSAEEAKGDADAKYKRAQLVAVKLKFDVWGDPHLLAKSVVRFDAWGGGKMSKRISGLYYVSEVVHDITRGNYVCHLETRTDGGGSTGGAKTKSGSNANQNKDDGSSTSNYPIGEIKALEEIDPETRETRLIWSDSRGRPWSSMEDNFSDEGNISPG